MDKTALFIQKAKSVHGDKFRYDNAVYTSARVNLRITCPEHGDFNQMPNNHLRGAGCPSCSGNVRGSAAFLKKAKEKHGNRYDYSKVEYVRSTDNVIIVCDEHGEFEQSPAVHLRGSGCTQCALTRLGRVAHMTTSVFVERVKSKHGDKYDYSKVDYVNTTTAVTIICPIHGEFEQLARIHLAGSGCTKCSNEQISIDRFDDTDSFIEKVKLTHGDKYDYSKVEYTGSKDVITIICPDHGEFIQIPNNHQQSQGCPKCSGSGPSKAEQMIFELCQSNVPDMEQSNRTAIAPYELDIYSPSLQLAIEYNGTYWHSEKYRHKKYHQKKFLDCQEKGIQLFQIWEHDWVDPAKQGIILSMLRYKLGKARRVYARKTKIIPVTYKVAKTFYNENHLQGAGMCHSKQTHYSLVENGLHVMMMSVDYRTNYIVRVCTAKGLAVVGGASKLFKRLPAGDYMSYGSNDLGGTLTHYPGAMTSITEPRYFWWKNGEKIQRQSVQKHKLADKYPDFDGSTEVNWMRSIGYHRVFDSGNTKIEFTIDP